MYLNIDSKQGEWCKGVEKDYPSNFDKDKYKYKLGFSKRVARDYVNNLRKKI